MLICGQILLFKPFLSKMILWFAGKLNLIMQILTVVLPYSTTTSNFAISCKSLYKWLTNNGFPIKTSKSNICLQNIDYYRLLLFPEDDICDQAAYNGDLPLLKWARQNGCEWSGWTCAFAAKGGELKVLKWLRKNKCHWGWRTCAYAARDGHLEILKWARKNEAPWNEWTFGYAAHSGQIECLAWALRNSCPIPLNFTEYLTRHPKVKKWARENNYIQ